MALVLDDVMLEKLICDMCKKYLSVLPVKVYKYGVTKCGRCCKKDDEGTISLYEKLVINCLFKCVNRYECCNKLLMPSEVMAHEKNCISGNYKCPKCDIQFSGSGYELLHHYKDYHPESILNKNKFQLYLKKSVRESERYLYLKNNKIFFILVEDLSYEDIVYLSVVSLKQYDNVEQQFIIKQLRRNRETKIKPCTSLASFTCDYFKINVHEHINNIRCTFNIISLQTLDIYEVSNFSKTQEIKEMSTVSQYTQTIPVKNILSAQLTQTKPSVQLTTDFKKKYHRFQLSACGTALYDNMKRIPLTCSNCGQFTGCNVFICKSNEHLTCLECKAWCGICNSQMDGYNAEISFINKMLLLPCTWNCGENFSGEKLWSHQAECEKSFKQCPVSTCVARMPVSKLLKHLYVTHSNFEYVNLVNLENCLEHKNCIFKNIEEIYVMQNKIFFRIVCTRLGNASYDISIEACEDIDCFETAVIFNDSSYTKFFYTIRVKLDDNPKLYLKWNNH